jgi:hypothetical protein
MFILRVSASTSKGKLAPKAAFGAAQHWSELLNEVGEMFSRACSCENFIVFALFIVA